jgi:hypothetical protein
MTRKGWPLLWLIVWLCMVPEGQGRVTRIPVGTEGATQREAPVATRQIRLDAASITETYFCPIVYGEQGVYFSPTYVQRHNGNGQKVTICHVRIDILHALSKELDIQLINSACPQWTVGRLRVDTTYTPVRAITQQEPCAG